MSLHSFVRNKYNSKENKVTYTDVVELITYRDIQITNYNHNDLNGLLLLIRKMQVEDNPHTRRHTSRDIQRLYFLNTDDWDINNFVNEENIIEVILDICETQFNTNKNNIVSKKMYIGDHTFWIPVFKKFKLDCEMYITYFNRIMNMDTINKINEYNGNLVNTLKLTDIDYRTLLEYKNKLEVIFIKFNKLLNNYEYDIVNIYPDNIDVYIKKLEVIFNIINRLPSQYAFNDLINKTIGELHILEKRVVNMAHIDKFLMGSTKEKIFKKTNEEIDFLCKIKSNYNNINLDLLINKPLSEIQEIYENKCCYLQTTKHILIMPTITIQKRVATNTKLNNGYRHKTKSNNYTYITEEVIDNSWKSWIVNVVDHIVDIYNNKIYGDDNSELLNKIKIRKEWENSMRTLETSHYEIMLKKSIELTQNNVKLDYNYEDIDITNATILYTISPFAGSKLDFILNKDMEHMIQELKWKYGDSELKGKKYWELKILFDETIDKYYNDIKKFMHDNYDNIYMRFDNNYNLINCMYYMNSERFVPGSHINENNTLLKEKYKIIEDLKYVLNTKCGIIIEDVHRIYNLDNSKYVDLYEGIIKDYLNKKYNSKSHDHLHKWNLFSHDNIYKNKDSNTDTFCNNINKYITITNNNNAKKIMKLSIKEFSQNITKIKTNVNNNIKELNILRSKAQELHKQYIDDMNILKQLSMFANIKDVYNKHPYCYDSSNHCKPIPPFERNKIVNRTHQYQIAANETCEFDETKYDAPYYNVHSTNGSHGSHRIDYLYKNVYAYYFWCEIILKTNIIIEYDFRKDIMILYNIYLLVSDNTNLNEYLKNRKKIESFDELLIFMNEINEIEKNRLSELIKSSNIKVDITKCTSLVEYKKLLDNINGLAPYLT